MNILIVDDEFSEVFKRPIRDYFLENPIFGPQINFKLAKSFDEGNECYRERKYDFDIAICDWDLRSNEPGTRLDVFKDNQKKFHRSTALILITQHLGEIKEKGLFDDVRGIYKGDFLNNKHLTFELLNEIMVDLVKADLFISLSKDGSKKYYLKTDELIIIAFINNSVLAYFKNNITVQIPNFTISEICKSIESSRKIIKHSRSIIINNQYSDLNDPKILEFNASLRNILKSI